MTFSNTFALALSPNDFRLPLNLYIIRLPVDGSSSLNWAMNYIFQLVTAFFSTVFFLAYLPLTMLFMNHACWTIECVLLAVKRLNELLEALNPVEHHLIEEHLFQISGKICKVIKYQNSATQLLKFIFLAEFCSLTAIFCMCLKAIATTLDESKNPLTAVLINLWQLFVYCWIGSRVKSFADLLAMRIYAVEWGLLPIKQQHDWLLTLAICQNLRGFHGIFKRVDLETFQNVKLYVGI